MVERVELVGGTHPGGREEPAGGTRPSALRAPWSSDREECMWAGPTQGGEKNCLNLAILLL